MVKSVYSKLSSSFRSTAKNYSRIQENNYKSLAIISWYVRVRCLLPWITKLTAVITNSTHITICKSRVQRTFSSARANVRMPCHHIWTRHNVRVLVGAVDVSGIGGRIREESIGLWARDCKKYQCQDQ